MIIGLLALSSVSAFANCKVLLESKISEKVAVALVENNYELTTKRGSEIDFTISESEHDKIVDYFGVPHYQGGYVRSTYSIDFAKVYVVDGALLRKPVITANGSSTYDRDHWSSLPPISFGDAKKKAMREFVRKINKKGECKNL